MFSKKCLEFLFSFRNVDCRDAVTAPKVKLHVMSWLQPYISKLKRRVSGRFEEKFQNDRRPFRILKYDQ